MSTVQVLQNSLETFSRASFGPVPSDIYEAQYWEMAGAHGCIIVGLLNIYEKSSTIEQKDLQDFLKYALQWIACLDHHHHWEETIYYPMFNPKFNTESIVAEHETFHAGFVKLKEYLISCLPPKTTWGYGEVVPEQHTQREFDAATFRGLVDGFVGELTDHLLQEIIYLEPSKVRASGLTKAEMKVIASVSEKHMMSMPPTTFLMYTIIHSPPGSGFPPVPAPVKHIIAPYVFYWPNRKLWKFAPKV